MSRRRLTPLLLPDADDDPVSWSPTSLLRGIAACYRFENAAELGHDDLQFIPLSVVGSSGSVTQVTGKLGYGVTCSGKYLRGDGATSVDPALGITFCGWFKTDNATGVGTNRVLVSLQEPGVSHTAANPDCSLLINSTGGSYGAGHVPVIEFYDSGDTYRSLTATALGDPTQWHFFVVKFANGAQSIQIDNGTPVTSSYTIDTVLNAGQSLKRVTIGAAQTSCSVTADGVLIYGRILTDDEIAALWAGGSGRAFGFGWEATLSRVTAAADSASPITPAVLSRVTAAATSATVLTPATLSRVTAVAGSALAVTPATLSRCTSAADSAIAVTPATLSRVTSAADSAIAVTPAILSRVTAAADSDTLFVTDPATLSRVTAAANSAPAVTPATLLRVTAAADSAPLVTPALLSRVTATADSALLGVASPAMLSRVTAAATSNRTARYAPGTPRPEPDFYFVFPKAIASQLGSGKMAFLEETHNRITATLQNEHSDNLNASDFDLILLTLHNTKTGSFLRKTMLATELVTLEDGDFSWLLQPRDTDLIDESKTAPESHVATFEFAHAADQVHDLVDAFAVTAESNVITVTHPLHGLELKEHVWFNVEEEVGGLSLTGLFVVQEVVDANTYRTVAHIEATSTASGGGNVVAYLRAYSNKWVLSHTVSKADQI